MQGAHFRIFLISGCVSADVLETENMTIVAFFKRVKVLVISDGNASFLFVVYHIIFRNKGFKKKFIFSPQHPLMFENK